MGNKKTIRGLYVASSRERVMTYLKKKKQSGAALLVVLAVSSLLIPLIQGLWLDTQVEYNFSRYRMSELQARYNAKAGMNLNLLRLYIFKGAAQSIPEGQFSSIVRPLLDKVWSFPFVWPFPTSEGLLGSEKEEIQSLMKDSFLRGSYAGSLQPQDGLFDINDLSSPLPFLREFTYEGLFNLLLNAIEDESSLEEKYEEKDLRELLNNLSDWTDLDNQSQNGGEETRQEEGKTPLNRSFLSLEEIRKTPKVNVEMYQILKPHITLYGSKALNINYASREVLRALDIPETLIEEILSRTQANSEFYAPFLNQKDFCDFMLKFNFSFCENLKDRYGTLDVLTFDYPLSFQIRSSGGYKGEIVELSALLYDLSSLASNYQKSRYYEIQRQKEEAQNPLKNTDKNQERGKKEPESKQKNLKIDYSYYKSLIIMYLKENF